MTGGELPEVMGVTEVAAWLGCSDQHVRNLAARGEMPGKKIGQLWRFSRRRLAEWFEQQGGAA